MSLAREGRPTDEAAALQLMLQNLGDRRISDCLFDVAQAPLNVVPQAIWLDLQENSYVEHSRDSRHYILTGRGWLRALQESRATQDKTFRRTVSNLIEAIKKHFKGGHVGRMVSPQTLAQESGIPENWIYNAVESNLIEGEFQKRGIVWANGFEGKLIHVPAAFGSEL